MFQTFTTRFQQIGQKFYRRLNGWTHGRAVIPVEAARRFNQTAATIAASSLAFYAIFSLFPLLGVLVSLISFIVPPDRIHALLLEAIAALFPVSVDLISQNIDRFIKVRGTISIVGTLGLLWSASNVFTILIHQIDLAWEKARVRSYVQNRLIAAAMVVILVLLIGVLWLLTGLFDLLAQLEIPLVTDLRDQNSIVWKVITVAASPLLGFIVFFMLYRWVPNTRVKPSEAAWGAMVVTVVWSITGLLFNWYVGIGLSSYNLLYGSLAALAVLMLWFYINSVILLFGAHLCASIARWREKNRAVREIHKA